MILVEDPDFLLIHGDVLDVLPTLDSGSVDCVVTSPPYWGLRDYGTDGQLGLEPTPDLYVEPMVAVFREVRRVLADHGTCWINIGDSYHGGGGYAPDAPSNLARAAGVRMGRFHGESRATSMARVKPKCDYLDPCPCEDGGPCEREVEPDYCQLAARRLQQLSLLA